MAYASSSSAGTGPGDPAAFSMLEVQIQRTASAVTRLANESDFVRITLIGNEAGVRTILDTVVYATDDWPGVFDTTQKPLCRDQYDGSTGSLNYISVYLNGREVAQLSPVNSDIANSSGLDFGGGFTGRVGLVFNGNSYGTGKACRARGGRIVDPPTQGVQSPSVGRPDFVAFGENLIYSGVLDEDLLMVAATRANHDATNLETGQVGLYGRYVSALTKVISLANEAAAVVTRKRVLATDGEDADIHSAIVYDPIDRKTCEWDITKGGAATDLLGFRLCANHGPGVMIAAPETNRGIVALCAKVDKAGPVYAWQNFNPADSGIAATSDRAWISNVSDEIVALIEIPGDAAQGGGAPYETLLMCSNSITSVRGDPRVDGGVVTVSTSAGILGPEAWCFDNRGNLWWVGNGGMHAMPKGSRSYTKTDGRKLPEWFELARVDRRQVILRFRASDNTILCYLSPRIGGPDEGEKARVAVYDVEAKEFTKDEYPADVGPAAAVSITGQKPEDRDVVLCGADGRIYRYSDAARSDNGEAIDWMVSLIAPKPRGLGNAVEQCESMYAVAAPGSGSVSLSIYTARSARQVQAMNAGVYIDGILTDAETADREYTLFELEPGEDRVMAKVAGAATKFVFRQFSGTETVALEEVQAEFEPVGDQRF